jgi:hypothetical protein
MGRRSTPIILRRRFTPFSIPGCVLWFDPFFGLFSQSTGPLATTPVVNPYDVVGTYLTRTGQYFTAGAINRPALLFGGNGRPYLQPDGVDDFLTRSAGTAGPALAEPCVLLANVRPDSGGGSDYCLLTGATAAGGGAKWKAKIVGNVQQAGRDQVANFGTSATALTLGAWYRIGALLGAPAGTGKCVYRLNGAADGAADSSAVAVTGDPRLFASQIGGEFFKGGCGDVAVFNRELTPSEYARMDRWMAGRAPTFYPNAITNLVAFVAADQNRCFTDTAGTSPVSGGFACARVNDQSVSNAPVTQATGANQPIWSLDSGRGILTYDATDRLFGAVPASVNGGTGLTVFLRGKYPLVGTQKLLFGKFTNYGTQASWMIRDDGTNSGFQFVITADGGVGGGTHDHNVIRNNGNGLTGYYTVVAWYDPTGGQIGIRVINAGGDNTVTAATAEGPLATATDPLDFGGAGSAAVLRCGLAYNRFLTAAERQADVDWMAAN